MSEVASFGMLDARHEIRRAECTHLTRRSARRTTCSCLRLLLWHFYYLLASLSRLECCEDVRAGKLLDLAPVVERVGHRRAPRAVWIRIEGVGHLSVIEESAMVVCKFGTPRHSNRKL